MKQQYFKIEFLNNNLPSKRFATRNAAKITMYTNIRMKSENMQSMTRFASQFRTPRTSAIMKTKHSKLFFSYKKKLTYLKESGNVSNDDPDEREGVLDHRFCSPKCQLSRHPHHLSVRYPHCACLKIIQWLKILELVLIIFIDHSASQEVILAVSFRIKIIDLKNYNSEVNNLVLQHWFLS